MKLNTKLALLLIAGTAGYVAFQNLDLLRGGAKDEDPALLFNRIWMESKPTGDLFSSIKCKACSQQYSVEGAFRLNSGDDHDYFKYSVSKRSDVASGKHKL